jgi:uncharacterized protein (UPF0303 family)
MDIADLKEEAARLIFERFDEDTALELGIALVELAWADALPVVINIRTASRTLFHAALPGSAPDNEDWARRKSATALQFHKSSLQVGLELRAKDRSLAYQGLSMADYADHGGAVPVQAAGVGVVAVATVSGLPQLDDHALVIRAMEQILAAQAGQHAESP